MNDRLADEIQLLAFGELERAKASRVQALVDSDPEAKALFTQFQGMRKGFSLVHDVPPDQLSKERLRARILEGGLRQKKEPIWTWLFMPAAAAALSFVLYTGVFHKRADVLVPTGSLGAVSSETPLAFNKDVRKFDLGDTPSFDEPISFSPDELLTTPDASPLSSVSTDGVPIVSKPVRHAKRTSRRSSAASRKAQPASAKSLLAVAPSIANEPRGMVAFRDSNPPTETSGALIMISSNRDARTGAQQATVSPNSDVIISD